MANNLIYNLDNVLFKYLNNLKELYLCQNKLEMVRKENFEGLFRLSLLDLSQNQLTTLDENVFDLTPGLETLNLKSNQINIWSQSFSKLTKCKHLYLSGNNLNPI